MAITTPKRRVCRRHNQLEDFLDEASEVFDFLVSQLRIQTTAPFYPYIDQIIPMVRETITQRIAQILASDVVEVPKPAPIEDPGERKGVPVGRAALVVNDTFNFGNDRKRFVIVGTQIVKLKKDLKNPYGGVWEAGTDLPLAYAVELSGGDKKTASRLIMADGYDESSMFKMRFPTPIFYGKSARKRYEEYVETMKKLGNEAQIVPFEQAEDKPEEPEPPPPPSDVSEPEDADVRISHTVQDGTLVDWDSGKSHPQFEEIKKIIQAAGFKWSREYGFWYRTNSVGLLETRAPIHRMMQEFHKLGLKVHLDLQTGDEREAIERRQEFLRQRGSEGEERAEKLREKAGIQQSYAERQVAQAQEKVIATLDIPGYFPTPHDLAYRLATLASVGPRQVILEPSAGAGDLVRAIRARVQASGGGEDPYPATIDAIEISQTLIPLLQQQGIPVVATDIFDPSFQPGTMYDRIVMNPPFERGASIDHVERAYSFLRPGGTLVALMPKSIEFREDNKHTAFRQFLQSVGAQTFEVEPQSFGRSGDVSTVIVRIQKPSNMPSYQGDPGTLEQIKAARSTTAIPGGALQRSREATAGIPMGQPVLKGHHSQRKHEKALERAEAQMQKSVEMGQKAAHVQHVAEQRARRAGQVETIDVTKKGRSGTKKKTSVFSGDEKHGFLGINLVSLKKYIGANSVLTRASTGRTLIGCVVWEWPEYTERDYRGVEKPRLRKVCFDITTKKPGIGDQNVEVHIYHNPAYPDESTVFRGEFPLNISTEEATLIFANLLIDALRSHYQLDIPDAAKAEKHRAKLEKEVGKQIESASERTENNSSFPETIATKYGIKIWMIGPQFGSSTEPPIVSLESIIVPKDKRDQGIGTMAMNDIVSWADSLGYMIALDPSGDFGGSPKRLKEFYGRFGFVQNKGRNKDFRTSRTMIRYPQRTGNPKKPLQRAQACLDDFNATCQRKYTHFRPFSLHHCPLAESDHAKEERVFAHTLHLPNTVCVCQDIEKLNDDFLYGIMAHEFGHILADVAWNDQSEPGADTAAHKFLGTKINYGSPLALEYLSASDVKRVKNARSR